MNPKPRLPFLLAITLLATNAVSADNTCNTLKTITRDSPSGVLTIHYPAYLSPTGIIEPTCHLSQGNSGAPVTSLQESMNHCNGQSVVVNGNYWTATVTAVGAVQASVGMTNNGIWDQTLGERMYWWADVAGGGQKCSRIA